MKSGKFVYQQRSSLLLIAALFVIDDTKVRQVGHRTKGKNAVLLKRHLLAFLIKSLIFIDIYSKWPILLLKNRPFFETKISFC